MAAETWVDGYTNKIVPFTFSGQRLSFRLSHALFSSYDIDDGTRLLLKTVAQGIDLHAVRSILDVGCGVGVLGVSVARAASADAVVLQDRDALAVAFAEANSRENGLRGAEARCALAFQGLGGRRFDLVVANLPAKAGPPVLRHFCGSLPGVLAPQGIGAVVVVAPIASIVEEAMAAAGCQLSIPARTREYVVFHARTCGDRPAAVETDDGLAPYIRQHSGFRWRGEGWELDTAFNLPDFDSLGHAVGLALALLPADGLGDAVFWNPGQGHLPVFAARRGPAAPRRIVLAGRDALELAVAGRNLRAAGREPDGVVAVAAEPALADALGVASADFICATAKPVPGVQWYEHLAAAASVVLRPGGKLLAAGGSTEMQRLVDAARGMRRLDSRRHAGFRAVLLARRS